MGIGLAIAGVAAAGAGAYATSQAAKAGGNAPKVRPYHDAYDQFRIQQDYGPAAAKLTDIYGPYYAAAQDRLLERSLLGGARQDVSSQYNYRFGGNTIRSGTVSFELPETRGLVDLYSEAASRARASDIADLQRYGPELTSFFQNQDPRQAALLNQLYGQASRDLSTEVEDDPEIIRGLQQAARAAQSARGFGYSSGDAINEAAFVGREGALFKQGLKQQRQDFGLRTLGAGAALTPDISQILLGRTGVVPFGAANNASAGAGARMPIYGPTGDNSVGIANAQLQSSANANQGNLYGALGGSAFNLAGGLIGQYYGNRGGGGGGGPVPYAGAGGDLYYSQRLAGGGGVSLPYGGY